jgi:hypothetical protein
MCGEGLAYECVEKGLLKVAVSYPLKRIYFKCGFSREEKSRVHESRWATC